VIGLAEAAVLAYFALMLVIGAYGAQKVKTVADFVAASRKLGFWMFCLLMASSLMSGMTALGVAGLGYLSGYANWWEQLAVPSALAVAIILYGVKLNPLAHKYNYLTLQDYLAHRYNDKRYIRGISGMVSAFVSTVYLIGQYVAIGIVVKVVLGWEYWQGCLLATIVVVLYVLAGGLISVAWTSFLQGLILLFGILLLTPPLINSVGGWVALNEKLAMITSGPFAKWLTMPWGPWEVPLVSPMFNFTLFGLAVLLGLSVAPHIINNVIVFKEPKYVKWAPLAVFLISLPVLVSVKLIGMAGRVAVWEGWLSLPAHPVVAGSKWQDMILPMLAKQVLPYSVFVFIAVIILAAVMSTTDRLMLTVATNIGYDIFKNMLKPTAKDYVVNWISRLTVIVLGVIVYILALTPPPLIAWLIWTALGVMFTTWFPVVVAGLYWRRANRPGAIAGMLAGFVGTIVAGYVAAKPPIGLGIPLKLFGAPFYFPLVGFITSLVALIIVSLLTRPEPEQILNETMTGVRAKRTT